MKSKYIKASIVINILITTLVVLSTIFMFTGFRFMPDIGPKLESTSFGMFRFFTVDSNIFMGIISLIFAIEEIKLLKGSIKEIPLKHYILKLMATTSVFLTFFVVFAYLGPISKGGVKTLLVNSNLFYHLVVPVLSIITFMFFEKTNVLKLKNTLYGILPMFAYATFYIINILIHMKDGKVSTLYDWYWFVQRGVWTAVIVVPLMFLITYGLSFLLWKVNKKK